MAVPSDFHAVIIGSGVSGICMGKKFNDVGIKYTILEKSADLGIFWSNSELTPQFFRIISMFSHFLMHCS